MSAAEIEVPSPQEDFYQHVNKKWIEDPENAIPPEYSSWGGFLKLHDESLKNQIQLLNEIQEKQDRSVDEQKLAMIWDAAIEKFRQWDTESSDDATNKANYQPLTDELTQLTTILRSGEGNRIERLASYFGYAAQYNIRHPLDFDKGSDLTSSMDVILDLSAAGLSLPTRDYYFEDEFESQRKLFQQHLSNVAKIMNDCGIELEPEFESKVFSFQCDLAMIRMKSDQRRLYSEYYTNTSLERFITEIDSLNSLEAKLENYPEEMRKIAPYSEEEKKVLSQFMEKLYGDLNLRSIMKENYEKDYNGTADEERLHRMAVFDGDYFRRLFRILFDDENESRLMAYLQYNVITGVRFYCTKALDEEFFDFYSRQLSGQKEQKSTEKRTIQRINSWVGELLGKIYVAKHFSPDSKVAVERMIDTVLEIMKESLQKNDWLTEPTKQKALEKLAKFTKKIGFPDKWKDYSRLTFSEGDSLYDIRKKIIAFMFQRDFLEKLNTVKDLTEWHMTPQTVNAYFSPTNNEIVFPAAIIQPPFYSVTKETIDFEYDASNTDSIDVCLAANFGGIGAVIAHEITHGFDDQGRKFDGDGNLVDWWTEEDAALFKAKTELMGAQADLYEFSVTNDEGNVVTHKMRPQLTMGENLADLGGLSLGKQALLHHLKGKDDESIRAALKILFISWANVWKFKASDELRVQRLASDPHAPADFRGNLLKNIDEFYSLFDVKEGDKMFIAPEKRVVMW
uniref:Uncharacterized protein n=1 Tax=Vannella robusta TaxID=1487602 RepID=A0A7S4HLK8_9EUKA